METDTALEFVVEATAIPKDRRSSRRELVRQVATLQVLPLGNSCLRVRVYIMDVSEGGLGLQSPMNLSPGTLLRIKLAPMVYVTGVVRYTVGRENEYYSGVQVENIKDYFVSEDPEGIGAETGSVSSNMPSMS